MRLVFADARGCVMAAPEVRRAEAVTPQEHIEQLHRELRERRLDPATGRPREGSRQIDEKTGLMLWERGHYDRILAAGHIHVDELGPVGVRILRWLSGWDDHTTRGLEEILAKVFEAGRASARP